MLNVNLILRAILHDPEVYPHPEEFRPERFINSDGTLSEDDVAAVFGFGRRCVQLESQL